MPQPQPQPPPAPAPAPRDRVLVLRRDLAGWYGTPLRHRLGTAAGPADPGRLRFDLAANAGGLVSAGFWHDMRVRSYASSRAGDPRPAPTRTAAAPTAPGR